MPRSKLLITGGFFVAALALLPGTEFHTDVAIKSDGDRVVYSVAGAELEAPVRIERLTHLRLVFSPEIYPVGGDSLAIEQKGRVVFFRSLRGRFPLGKGVVWPTSDWYVDSDRSQDLQALDETLDLSGPFTIRTSFTGRSLNGIRLILETDTKSMKFGFRRGLLNNDFGIERDGTVLATRYIPLASADLARSLAGTFVRGLVAACVLVLVFGGIARLAAPPGLDALLNRLASMRRLPDLLAVVVVVTFVARTVWLAGSVFERLPHFQDDLAYLFRAKWLLAGHLTLPYPRLHDYVPVPFTFECRGHWASIYPIGWPLALACGEALHAAWLVPPFFGLVYVSLLYLLGRRLYGPWPGLVVLALASLSPMTNLMSASLLSHGSTAVFVLLFFFLLLKGWPERRLSLLFGAGAALGYGFGIRPLTGVVVAASSGAWLLTELARARREGHAWAGALCLTAGGVVGALPVVVDNWLVTGSPIVFAQQVALGHTWSLGSFREGLWAADQCVALILPMSFGWGWKLLSGWPILALSIGFALVPVVSGRLSRVDALLGTTFLGVILAYLGYSGNGVHGYGPRFYYEVFFCLFLLTARGLVVLAEGVVSLRGRPAPGAAVCRVLVTVMVVALGTSAAVSIGSRLALYKGYNYVDGRLQRAVEALPDRRALFIFLNPDIYAWMRVGNLLPVDMSADRVFVEERKDEGPLVESYPDRPWYTWDGQNLRLSPRSPVKPTSRPVSKEAAVPPAGAGRPPSSIASPETS
jgi:hypothetical protein